MNSGKFTRTVGQENLDHFVAFGGRHLHCLGREFLEHSYLERPYQALKTKTVVKKEYRRSSTDDVSALPLSAIACKTRLGGLLEHYYLRAAQRRIVMPGDHARKETPTAGEEHFNVS